LGLFYALCGVEVLALLASIIPRVLTLETTLESLLRLSQVQEFAQGLDVGVQTMADLVVERRSVSYQAEYISTLIQALPETISVAQRIDCQGAVDVYQYLQEVGNAASDMVYSTRGVVVFSGTSGPEAILNSDKVGDVSEFIRRLDVYNRLNYNLLQALQQAHREIILQVESGFRIPIPMMLGNIIIVSLLLLLLRQGILWLLHNDFVKLGAASSLLSIQV